LRQDCLETEIVVYKLERSPANKKKAVDSINKLMQKLRY
jgi:hypothetical protein